MQTMVVGYGYGLAHPTTAWCGNSKLQTLNSKEAPNSKYQGQRNDGGGLRLRPGPPYSRVVRKL